MSFFFKMRKYSNMIRTDQKDTMAKPRDLLIIKFGIM